MKTIPDIDWLDRYFVSAFTINDDGRAQLTATETETIGDDQVTIRGTYEGLSTPNASVVELAMPWLVAPNELWAIEVYVTCKSANCAIRRRIKLSALVWGDGATATLDAAPTSDITGTGTATATITVAGSAMRLELSPVAATPLVWGFELRAQKL